MAQQWTPEMLQAGMRLMVQKQIDEQVIWQKAEIMSIRQTSRLEFYVHFIDFNKRLDEWVGVDRLKLDTVEPAAASSNGAGKKGAAAGKGPKTPAAAAPADKKNIRHGRKSLEAPVTPSGGSVGSRATPTPSPAPTADSFATQEQAVEREFEKLRRGGSMTQRPEEIARVKNIETVEMGPHLVQAWYFSPYPEEICGGTISLCEFCLDYFGQRESLLRHRQKCPWHHPPGNEIYRHGKYSFWELDGHRQKTYCRRLCLLSKLFLDHKTLLYDVDPFMFYLLTENDGRGCHLLGYFSKEKESLDNYNLACILCLPQHQRKGYGRLLIDFSYELTRREGKLGSPEKPLSDLGLLSYQSYWSEAIVRALHAQYHLSPAQPACHLSIEQLSRLTGITTDDILFTLQSADAIRYQRGQYCVVVTERMWEAWERSLKKHSAVQLDPKCLHWTPPTFTPAQLRFL